VGHASDKADRRGGRTVSGLRAQLCLARAAADQQQSGIRLALDQCGHRGDQVVQPFVVIEAADEADHRAVAQLQIIRQRRLARGSLSEQVQVDPVGAEHDLVGGHAAQHQIVLQALADRDDGIGPGNDVILQRAGQPVFQVAFGAGAVADGGILPEGADFIDHRNAQPPCGDQRGLAVQRGRMGVKQIGPPLSRQRHDGIGQQIDFAPFPQPRWAARRAARAMKSQPFGLFDIRARRNVAQAGDPAHFQPHRLLRFQDRAGAKGIAAVHRQRMIEDMENARHGDFP